MTYAGDVAGRQRRADGGAAALGSPVGAASSVRAIEQLPDASFVLQPSRARIRVRTRSSGAITLFTMTDTATAQLPGGPRLGGGEIRVDAFRPLCVAPCTTELAPGAYVFGVAEGDRSARRVGAPLQIDGDALLYAEFDDRSGLRALGWLSFILGVAGGLAWVTVPALGGGSVTNDFGGDLGLGLGTLALGTLIALPLVLLNDAASVRVASR